MQSRKLLFHLGNFLIGVSLLGIIYTIYPVISIYLFPPQAKEQSEIKKQKGFYISIPKIKAYSKVIENVDPWLESEYQQALKNGVAHAKGTSLPGRSGTVFLFAHSSGSPWDITYTNTIFLRLAELNVGDEINLTYNGTLHSYKVKAKKEVWPQETEFLENIEKTQLILQTCTPIGTSLKRLLVFAEE
jgi:LPXTG-site transpeptidase (sortase) family protein